MVIIREDDIPITIAEKIISTVRKNRDNKGYQSIYKYYDEEEKNSEINFLKEIADYLYTYCNHINKDTENDSEESSSAWLYSVVGNHQFYECSSCGKTINHWNERTRYCPNCGSKMKNYS